LRRMTSVVALAVLALVGATLAWRGFTSSPVTGAAASPMSAPSVARAFRDSDVAIRRLDGGGKLAVPPGSPRPLEVYVPVSPLPFSVALYRSAADGALAASRTPRISKALSTRVVVLRHANVVALVSGPSSVVRRVRSAMDELRSR